MPDDILSRTPPPSDARLAYGSDPSQFIDIRMPAKGSGAKPPYPLVINIHGGFWRAKYTLDHTGHLCAALAAKGLATANLEYRRVGNEGGGWPGTFEDLRAAYRYLEQNGRSRGFRANRIVVIGHSAGGQLALCLGARETDIAGVVSLAGVVDLQQAYQLHLSNDAVVEFLHGTPEAVPDHYREADPMKLAIPHAKQYLIHGQADDTVPPTFSRDYAVEKKKRSGSEKEDVHLLEIANADHLDLIDPRSGAWQRVEQAVLGLAS
jgi:acetyl esterase/lipase